MQVAAGSNLQNAIDSAACGDIIKLEAGAVFTGHLLLPKKPCDDAHWIIIRTSASDDALPAEGTRLTPCYAGIASLPGRPDFHCTSVKNVMAKIVFAGKAGSGPIFFDEGANHYRLIGIEVTRESPGASIVALAGPKGWVPADHIIFDRVWMHGVPQDETRRGLFLSGTTYMAVVDSFFSDFHCTAMVACVDSQAISGAAGDLPMGPYKIVNNFLEASGENIILGGGAATKTPADIEIRHNHFFKPMIWLAGQPGFVGGSNGKPFIVKNNFELKNAERVLFEGNVLEGSWGGFSQAGFSIVLTPKNANNECPVCRVTDVTIRYCKIVHVSGGFLIANVEGAGGSYAAAGERYSVHDVVIDDIDDKKYNGRGAFMQISATQPILRDVKIDHITALSTRVLFNMGNKGQKFQNIAFANNLIGFHWKQITNTGGGEISCAFQADRKGPAGVLKDCVDSLTFTNNAIINGFGAWPAGNFFPKDIEEVGLASGREFRLCRTKDAVCQRSSKYAAAGTDGKDIGADMDLINAATEGVI
ncbi:MAG TPA: hypothetical protein VMG82_40080 [Candidatus Sulfotelmatobacter sp.]|nr:hypothetical protein [Candidatus Sulfotelmatobacter sp.]